ncbi:hypothetical protein [Natronobacterium texcoconense]|uniref:Uncharacterized protein n=1 Tax=Natronobacterium texcoconense TaxID=1095778 RepID=A0A1H1ALZ6_NATTX|nr:hypothetical protein [Natronobacterium texcoconense]SDQ40521.1 hypothetical protein SAMN04489842_0734 [Natronobacterium texcoconense]
MIQDLQTGGNALEEHGYEVCYSIEIDGDHLTRKRGSEPEEALNEFFDYVRRVEKTKIEPSTDALLGVFEDGSEENVKNAVNELFSHFKARIDVDEPGVDQLEQSVRPPVQRAFIDYRPQLQGGVFKLSYGAESAEPYIDEFEDLFAGEGLRVERYDSFR